MATGSIGDWDFNERFKFETDFVARMAAAQAAGGSLGGAAGLQSTMASIGGATSAGRNPIFAAFPPTVMLFTGGEGFRPPEVDQLVASTQAQVTAIEQQATQTIQAAQGQLAADKDQNSFIARMEAAREETKQKVAATIDQAYDQMVAIGQQNPAAQDMLVQALGEIAALGQSATNAVESSYNGAISVAQQALQAIEDAAEATASALQEAAEQAAQGVSQAASAVKEGFEQVFSGW